MTKRLPALILVLNDRFGWKGWRRRKLKVTRGRPGVEDVDPDAVRLIREYDRFHAALYCLALDLFDQTVRDLGPVFRGKARLAEGLNRGLDRLRRR